MSMAMASQATAQKMCRGIKSCQILPCSGVKAVILSISMRKTNGQTVLSKDQASAKIWIMMKYGFFFFTKSHIKFKKSLADNYYSCGRPVKPGGTI
jgi:hypothetical protein